MSLKITKDDAVWQNLKKTMLELNKKEVQVGFINNETYDDDINVAQVAQWNNEGSISNPRRPFFTSVINEIQRGVMDDTFGEEAVKVGLERTNTNYALDRIGKAIQEEVIQSIEDTYDPPNSPKTISIKGSSHPLIDTGLMISSVKYKVTRRGKDE